MKGLSFSEPMVKAWMEGRKTVTRRLMNPQPEFNPPSIGDCWYERAKDKKQWHYASESHFRKGAAIDFGKYISGETVYIKETWMGTKDCLSYKASDPRQIIEFNYDRWRSPRFMPEWASRSHALIVSVRPERVQEISREDAHNEGFWPGANGLESWNGKLYGNAQLAFQACWESLHPGSWERNDWIWRIELEKV